MTKQSKSMAWQQISSEEAYRLTQAEFKGMVIQALSDIRSDISEVKRDKGVKGYITFGVSAFIAAIAGFAGGLIEQMRR